MIKETENLDIINSFLSNFDTSISEIGIYSKYLIFYINEEAVGFLNYALIYDRAEIEYIFVDEKNRRNNIASLLLEYLYKDCEKNNCTNITLEVRQSNIDAIKFYESQKFKDVIKREKYYKDEDGILMLKEML